MQTGDRESTQDWLVPDDPVEEISVARTVGAPAGPNWAAGAEILAEAERAAEAATAAAERAGISAATAEALVQRAERAMAFDADAGRAALGAAVSAEEAAAAAVSAQEQVNTSSALAEQTMRSLAGRVEATLSVLEARDRAAQRRAEEAERESTALREFSARADRIVLALRALEGDLDSAGLIGPEARRRHT